jgi:Domain of unknown function (DUF4252)
MTKMTMTMQLALAMVVIGGPLAPAQQMASGLVPAVPGIEVQAKISTNVSFQVKDELFAGAEKFAQGASEVSEINLDPSTMGMVGGGHGRDSDMARKLNFMVIHSYKYDKPGMYNMDDVEAFRKKLTDGSWSCPIHTRSKTESTDICSRTGADHETNEMVILSAEPRELTFIHMSGKMSLNELSTMGHGPTGLTMRKAVPTPPEPPAPPVAPH